MGRTYNIKVSNEWDIISVRIAIRELANYIGFNIIEKTKLEIAASELARNMINYANWGEILLHEVALLNKRGLKIIAMDHGSGIEDIQKALTDGFSTSNSLGYGLPSVKRLMDEFDIQSIVGQGTKIIAVKWLKSSMD